MSWNFAAALDALGASAIAPRPALIHGADVISFATLRERARGIAGALAALGLPRGAHVGFYLHNSPAYIELLVGAGLAGLSHANVNYRYLDEELVQLCTELDIRVLVYGAAFAQRVAAVRARLPQVVCFIEAGSDSCRNGFAVTVEALARRAPPGPLPECSGDDLLVIATGGTTGLPKGTLWRHEDLWRKLNVARGGPLEALGLTEHPATLDEHVRNVERLPPLPPLLVLSPLMHGAGLMMAILMLARGMPLLTLPDERFDAAAALDAIRAQRVGSLALVGDAFALPLLEELDRRPGGGLMPSLAAIVSTGAALSGHVKQGLLRHNPRLQIVDTLGSTEASGFAFSTSEPGVFRALPGTRVLDEQLRDVQPGSGEAGIIYASGYIPVGYYKDPERSATTFPLIDGRRYTRTGDRCTVRADGLLVLLGRDSTVINTGGEKVWTVEVERALLALAGVRDALVLGLPHPRFGRQVVALVEYTGEGTVCDEDTVRDQLRGQLADYKVPRRVFAVPGVPRAPNGKPDLGAAEQLARELAENRTN